MDVTLKVLVTPAGQPRSKSMALRNKKGEFKGIHTYTPDTKSSVRGRIAELADRKLPGKILTTRVKVDILAVYKRPQSRPKKVPKDEWKQAGLIWRPMMPDRDNIDKLVLDALKPFWTDDNLVVAGTILKAFAEKDGRPRLVVHITDDLPNPELLWDLALMTPQALLRMVRV